MEVEGSIRSQETVEEITLPTTRNCSYLSNQRPHRLSQVPTSQGPAVAAAFSLSSQPHFSASRNPLTYPAWPSWSGAGDSWPQVSVSSGWSLLADDRSSGGHVSLWTHCHFTSAEFSLR